MGDTDSDKNDKLKCDGIGFGKKAGVAIVALMKKANTAGMQQQNALIVPKWDT